MEQNTAQALVNTSPATLFAVATGALTVAGGAIRVVELIITKKLYGDRRDPNDAARAAAIAAADAAARATAAELGDKMNRMVDGVHDRLNKMVSEVHERIDDAMKDVDRRLRDVERDVAVLKDRVCRG